MKAFVISLIIFTLMLTGIVINNIYINNVADELTVMVGNIPRADKDGCYSEASRINEYWEKHQALIGMSVSFVELNRVSDNITALLVYADEKDVTEFECSKKLLLNSIAEMRRLESLEFDDIM